jgi:hypothetical protein
MNFHYYKFKHHWLFGFNIDRHSFSGYFGPYSVAIEWKF